ncbi:MAG: glutamine amidotransferase [Pelagibacteraceae bacterium TMED201]|nr:MAG: glutamine amidotransferase [Pelagibacteraceae bacterium TMED201]|tara:strand:+ start:1821 stop:2705 length:885 start_codon:yes stop_codon:yes gene_type:complete
MCGIVGIYLKSKKYESSLGNMLSNMLINMGSRGPDSAGFAIYKEDEEENFKYSLCLNGYDFEKFKKEIVNKITISNIEKNSDHVIMKSKSQPSDVIEILNKNFKEISIVGYGKSIEIFKQVGEPKDVVKKFNLGNFSGTHAIGHTRMATESAITTDGSHPYSTGEDECLVHNGSLSNHNNLRRKLKKNGINFNSENDTEVAAGYISNNLSNKETLKDTLKKCLKDLDGFYTFITGTRKGFAVLRDEIACKPAVIAETDDYVAIASEFQAMAHLPNVNNANIFEPEPGVVYSWGN